ncbi:MAG TPA: DUF554 domain-containing protein [Burkholderiaceae bacterium]|nr:DUF554 domain-containing protein [Burkholderiaceae bacterium]
MGLLVNSSVVVVGGILGTVLGDAIPRRVKEAMPLTCGIIAIGIGATMLNKANAIPAIALALLVGALIGELLFLERGLELAIAWFQKCAKRRWPSDCGTPQAENFGIKFATLLVLFCASSMGIFGSMHEGMTGNANVLLAKAMLDLFIATIFATELGFSVALIAVPQVVIQGLFYFSAYLLLPLASPTMLADFSACGGIIMLATGLRICGIKIFPIVNMLPALLLIMPCSALWSTLFG